MYTGFPFPLSEKTDAVVSSEKPDAPLSLVARDVVSFRAIPFT
jgi:hypothetical protein